MASWSDNPVYPRIKLLLEKSALSPHYPKYVKELPLISHLSPIGNLLNQGRKPKRPGYFDHSWEAISLELQKIFDKEEGFIIRSSDDPNQALVLFMSNTYPEYI